MSTAAAAASSSSLAAAAASSLAAAAASDNIYDDTTIVSNADVLTHNNNNDKNHEKDDNINVMSVNRLHNIDDNINTTATINTLHAQPATTQSTENCSGSGTDVGSIVVVDSVNGFALELVEMVKKYNHSIMLSNTYPDVSKMSEVEVLLSQLAIIIDI